MSVRLGGSDDRPRARSSDSRGVLSVIVDFRQVLASARPVDCPDVAAEYLCEVFGGSFAALNVMDYGRARFQTISNVGRLSPAERRRPQSEYYAFSDFPFTVQLLSRGGAYRSAIADADCPPEYRALLGTMRRSDCLGAPIRHGERALGEFWVARESGVPFTEFDEDLAVACGSTLARFFRPAWAHAG